jgi:GT2 family glycosyltransferase
MQSLQCEVIVVESSLDGTVELIEREFPSVRVVALGAQTTAGAARNLGVALAKGKSILFVDQDCIVPDDWIERLSRHLEEDGVGAVGGSIGFRNWSNYSGSAVYFLEFLYHFPSEKPAVRNGNFLIGCNLNCRREVFEQAKFPDRTLAEDVLFTSAVRDLGWDTVYDPSIEVSHWNREGWGEFFRYNAMMGRDAAAYHAKSGSPWSSCLRRFPLLAFFSPVVILPKIAFNLIGRWRYLLRFLLLSPMCLLGNWCWANSTFTELKRLGDLDRNPSGKSTWGTKIPS